MSDDDFRFWNEVRKEARRARGREAEAAVDRVRASLAEHGLQLRVCSDNHWQVWHGKDLIGDYWPTTQKAQPRGGSVHSGVNLTDLVSWAVKRA